MHLSRCSRRQLIKLGGRLVPALLLSGMPLSRRALAQETVDWRNEFAQVPTGGQGRVKEIKERATANNRILALGDIVKSGETLRVARGGHVIVSVQGGTIFNLKGEATLEFNASPARSGLFRLVAGSVLTVVPRGGRYLVQGPAATIGIKGTVAYRQVFREDEFEARATQGRTYTRPRNLTDYNCTCNGTVDYLRNEDRSLAASDKTGYHNAFFLDPTGGEMRNSAPLINHFDEDIDYLIGLQDGEKHDRSFLYKR